MNGVSEEFFNTLKIGDDEILVAESDTYRGWNNFFRVRVNARTADEAINKFKYHLNSFDLDDLLQSPTPDDVERYKLASLLWQHEKMSLYARNMSLEELRAEVSSLGINAKDAAKIVQKEVFPGYNALYNSEIISRIVWI